MSALTNLLNPRLLATSCLFAALAVGCAAPTEAGPSDTTEGAAASDLTQGLSDSALEGKLKGILEGVTFTSESDFPYVVVEGDVATETTLTQAVVRQKLEKAVKANSSSHRDILSSRCRAETVDVNKAIADGDAAKVPADKNDDDFTSAFHDRQLGIALKVMRSDLRSVVGFEFGTNATGDEDDVGPVVFVYAGISKTTGKLVAIMTEAVFT
jgi:hypothetical protein